MTSNNCQACVELTLEIQRTICRQQITGLNQFDFSRAMPTPNLRTGMLGERDWLWRYMQSSLRTGSQGELCSRTLLETGLRLHVFRIAFRNEKHLSVPFRKAIFMQRNYCNGAIYLTWEPAVYYGLPSNTDTSLIRTPQPSPSRSEASARKNVDVVRDWDLGVTSPHSTPRHKTFKT
jgi:hypothetical protein